IIIVDILPGTQRPYYIKSMGIHNGTFIRSGATTRLAETYMIQELILDGTKGSFDQLPAEGQVVTEEEIEKLCEEMTTYAKRMCRSDSERDKVRPLTRNQLLSWGLLVEKNGELLPSNGFCLLAGKPIPFVQSKIQCAVFKGTTRAVFVDRKEYSGSIQNQIDEAYDFVLRMIRMGAKIEGLYRQDVYEISIGTIREIICNAVCHRSYLEPANVQVALYDDRLEVTSPGMLSYGMSIEKIKEGYSKIRNRGIASAFAYMKIIESWGSGIPRIIQECKEYGLEEPELIDFDGDFRVNIYRKEPIISNVVRESAGEIFGSAGKVPEKCRKVHGSAKKVPESIELVEDGCYMVGQHKKIIEYIVANGFITSKQTEELLCVKQRRARAILNEMVKGNLIKKQGASRSTIYVLNEE
uniref:ATP-binding protein n=1 Tax=Anaerosporobacter sp. TaxID=1872529 RepID=UPI00286EE72E